MIREEFARHVYWSPADSHFGRFGLELETEVLDVEDYGGLIEYDYDDEIVVKNFVSGFWEVVVDHSLRNFGLEYVLKSPLNLDGVEKALEEFREIFKDVRFIKNAPGTSTHVHVNFRDEELTTLANFLTLWLLYENLLVNFSGETRRSNLFALPARCSDGVVRHICTFFDGLRTGGVNLPSEGMGKYGAVNIVPLGHLGSVEIRCFRGTVLIDEILQWVRILDSMVEMAKTFKDPYDVLEAHREGAMSLFYTTFGEDSEEILSGVDDPLFYIERNLWYATQVATVYDDWTPVNTMISEYWKKRDEELKNKKSTPKIDEFFQPMGATSQYNEWVKKWMELLESNGSFGMIHDTVVVNQSPAILSNPVLMNEVTDNDEEYFL